MTNDLTTTTKFPATLKRIKQLHGAVHGMQTAVESWIMEGDNVDREIAKTRAKEFCAKRGLNETDVALFIHASVFAELEACGSANALSEKEKEAILKPIWTRLKHEHEERVRELSELMRSLTPEQRKLIMSMNRNRLLRKERKKRKEKRKRAAILSILD